MFFQFSSIYVKLRCTKILITFQCLCSPLIFYNRIWYEYVRQRSLKLPQQLSRTSRLEKDHEGMERRNLLSQVYNIPSNACIKIQITKLEIFYMLTVQLLLYTQETNAFRIILIFQRFSFFEIYIIAIKSFDGCYLHSASML